MEHGWQQASQPRLTWAGMLAALGHNDTARSESAATSRERREHTRHFEAFFQQYEPRVTSYLWRMLGDEHVASDLSQETFIRAWRQFTEVRDYARPDAWLYQVATNLALHHLRRQRQPVGAATPLEDHPEPAMDDPAARIAEQAQVRATLDSLSPQQRAALILREIHGLSCDEVGSALGISRDAAKMTLSRARAAFRAAYQRQEDR
jgi:RNA polymerase sigma-70 factor (ECF subfamily)